MSTYRGALGARGEEIAAAYLQAHGYTIQVRNYRCRYGEIDLVCTHGTVLVFCEVKLRRSDKYGTPEEGVTPRKLARLALAAHSYLAEHGLEEADWRPPWNYAAARTTTHTAEPPRALLSPPDARARTTPAPR